MHNPERNFVPMIRPMGMNDAEFLAHLNVAKNAYQKGIDRKTAPNERERLMMERITLTIGMVEKEMAEPKPPPVEIKAGTQTTLFT